MSLSADELMAAFSRENGGNSVGESSDREDRMSRIEGLAASVGGPASSLAELMKMRAAARGANVELVQGLAPASGPSGLSVPSAPPVPDLPKPLENKGKVAGDIPVSPEPEGEDGPSLAEVVDGLSGVPSVVVTVDVVVQAASRIAVGLMSDPNYARSLQRAGMQPKDAMRRAEDDAVASAVRMFRKALKAVVGS